MWHEGTIGINDRLAHFWIKTYDTGSEYGIDGGRISKLQIKINGQTVANYDRGWDIKPDQADAIAAYKILLHEYN